MFDTLGERIQAALKRFSGRGALTEADVDAGLREVRMALLEADVNFKVARDFVAAVRERAVGQEVLQSLSPGQQVVKIVHAELVRLLGSDTARPATSGRPPTVWMLVGLQGSGKTTSSVKLALNARHDGRRPLVAGLDRQRPAAVEQLRVLCHNNQVPFLSSPDASALQLARDAVAEATRQACDLVILDTAGRLQVDQPLIAELQSIKAGLEVHSTLLVADAMSGQDAVNVASGFRQSVGLDGVILTKADGDARGGAALSIRAVTGCPVLFVGTGEKVTEVEAFHPERMASRILGMGDVLTLIEKAQQTMDLEKASEVQQHLMEGHLTMEDMLEQMRQLRRMGPLEGILGLLPGAGQLKKLTGQLPDERELGRVEAIILSMTPEERRRPAIVNGSRRRRIARGSGSEVSDVNRLLKGFQQMEQMVRLMSGKGAKGKAARRLKRMGGLNAAGIDPGMFKLS
ncbi:MAG: signal recognition particle protein [Candidatus Dormibacteria bacterium]